MKSISRFYYKVSLRTLNFYCRGNELPRPAIRDNSLPLPLFAVSLAPVASIDAGKAGSARDAREVLSPIRAVCISSRSPRCIKAIASQAQRIPASRDVS